MRLEAMAVQFPHVEGHPNRVPFEGVLAMVNAPSDKAPAGARGHRVVLTREAAETALPSLQIIMLTVYEDTDTIFKALRAGASGYLLKRSSHQEILGAIRDLLHGGAPMTAAIARKVVAAFHEPVKQEDPHTLLSGREREILDLLSAGLSNKEIGARLNVSQFTVKNHLANVFAKLHVRSRTQAVIAYLHPR